MHGRFPLDGGGMLDRNSFPDTVHNQKREGDRTNMVSHPDTTGGGVSPGTLYFIGIAGTAMGAVAAALQRDGYGITGSDEPIYPPMSELLAAHGIPCFAGFDAAHLEPAPDLVVIGNALSRGNVEVEAVLSRKIPYVSLPELIRNLFIGQKHAFVVAGTHGKTTTTALLAWIFHCAGHDPGYLIGGVPKNLPANCTRGTGDEFIIEGDEYDTAFFDKRSKFLHYAPEFLIINNLEWDHVDIFSSFSEMRRSFYHGISIVPPYGIILFNFDDTNVRTLIREHPVCAGGLTRSVSYGANDAADWQITRIRDKQGDVTFELSGNVSKPLMVKTGLCGTFQAYNVTAAVAAAVEYGIDADTALDAVRSFSGIQRRADVVGDAAGITVIDDFAHHPTAIRETLRAVKSKYRGRRVWAVFEPRSNSMRRNVFQSALEKALTEADAVILAGTNKPEKAGPGERLHPETVVENMNRSGKPAYYIPGVDEIIDFLNRRLQPGDVVIGMSNGSFGGFHQKLMSRLS